MRYNFDKNIRLDKICSDENFRPVLNNVYFKDRCAIATNGHAFVKVPLEEISNLNKEDMDKLNGKFLNRENYRHILQYNRITNIDDKGIECTGIYDKVKFLFSEEDKFPDYNKAFHDLKEGQVDRIAIIPNQLNNLCNAVGKNKDRVILTFNGKNHFISVKFEDSNIYAILSVCVIYDFE